MVFDPVRPELRPVLDNIARFAEDVRPKISKRRSKPASRPPRP